MTSVYLKKLTTHDDEDIYYMLSGISAIENSFTNPVKDMTFVEYKEWLIQQDEWDKGINLPKEYVPQTIYWLFVDDVPVGIGKIRHGLTESSRKNGGNIGYAISKPFRGKGYAKVMLGLLIDEAKRLGINELLLTVNEDNIQSQKVVEFNGGKMLGKIENKFIYSF